MKLLLPIAAFALIGAACSGETAPATPAPAPVAEAPAPAPAPVEVKDIVDTGLAETLKGPGPFTVFAPTDAAFAALPAGTVEDLLKPENKAKLTAILTYHVLPAEVMSTAVAGQTLEPATVQGAKLKVDGATTAGKVTVGDATVVTADVDASNGVIHVIDKVLMPPM
jgi:uncharacterized surface protein with fasciclin (FAS1) repeats